VATTAVLTGASAFLKAFIECHTMWDSFVEELKLPLGISTDHPEVKKGEKGAVETVAKKKKKIKKYQRDDECTYTYIRTHIHTYHTQKSEEGQRLRNTETRQ
jgi:predicted solute-binding protein